MGLIEDLAAGPVALDTAVFRYFIEENKVFLPVVRPIFEAIDRGRLVLLHPANPYGSAGFAISNQ